MKRVLVPALLCMVVVMTSVCLIGCAGKENITPTKIAYAEKQLAFTCEDFDKNAQCHLYIFENGEITYRSGSTLKLGSLVSLSDDEIEEAFRGEDRASRAKSHNYNNTFYEFVQNPKVSTVELITDASGNQTERETIAFDDYIAQQISLDEVIVKMDGPGWSHSDSFEFFNIVEPQPIFDGYFGGYKGNMPTHDEWGTGYFLIRVDNQESSQFEWDAAGTEGTTTY